MVEPLTVTKFIVTIADFLRKNWHIVVIVFIILIATPVVAFSVAINMLFPQIEVDDFDLYKVLTENTGINWFSFMAYDVVRLDNYLLENNPNESVFDFLIINFSEYEIVEKEEEVTKLVNGELVTETIITEGLVLLREVEATGFDNIKSLLETLEFEVNEENMTVENVVYFFEGLNEEDIYETESIILTEEEISSSFGEMKKDWYFALVEILPIIDPSNDFNADEFIIPGLIDNPGIPSIWPTYGVVTSEYGEFRITHRHSGIDIANSEGTPVVSTASGKVIAIGYSGGYGKRVMIYHGTDDNGNTYVTVYAHLKDYNVSLGDDVSQGDKIGEIGDTGYSTGAHLHYEVRVNGEAVNPRYFLY